eukprot:Phypoly_transcript_07073.p1 GENE.Phypoly_transcript_07073~~Phypoly_transcript_07073.p1  ORF type:complete len:240 (+),score=18.60 Phypoly_transcript_07073:47-721(+)
MEVKIHKPFGASVCAFGKQNRDSQEHQIKKHKMPHCIVGETRGLLLKMYFELHGSGPNKILFISGLVTNHHAWAPQITFFSKLSANYQICVFDNRGIGDTEVSYLGYSSSQMAQDALDLCDHLMWEDFHVVALSMGGMIAVELALHSPHRVLSLSLGVTHCGGFSAITPMLGIWKMLKSVVSGYDVQKRALAVQDMLYSKEFLSKPHKEGETMLQIVAKPSWDT